MTFRPVPPLVKWAQRTNLVFVTVCLEDCKDPEIKLEEGKLYFKGTGGTDKKEHEVTLEFFGTIDTEVRVVIQSLIVTSPFDLSSFGICSLAEIQIRGARSHD